MGFFDRLKEGLSKTRNSIANGLDLAFGDYSQVDDEFFETLEEVLIMADVGMSATDKIISRMKERVREEHIKDPEEVKKALIEAVSDEIKPCEDAYSFVDQKTVILVVGVNGVGKTTSIGKLAISF